MYEYTVITSAQSWKTTPKLAFSDLTYHLSDSFFEYALTQYSHVYGIIQHHHQNQVSITVCYIESGKKGNRLCIARCPVGNQSKESLQDLTNQYIKLAKKHNCYAIRLSPVSHKDVPLPLDTRWKPAQGYIHAETTRIIDLPIVSSELSKVVNSTVRNLINKCNKSIETGDLKITITQVWDEKIASVYQDSFARAGYAGVSMKSIRNEFESFSSNDSGFLVTCYHQETLLSFATVNCIGGTAYLRHTGNLFLYKQWPTAYLVQWEALKTAIESYSCKKFDLWGSKPLEAGEDHPWNGFSTFKKNFGGEIIEYQKTHDIALMPFRYWIYSKLEFYRLRKKGLLQ
jgi:FemAB family